MLRCLGVFASRLTTNFQVTCGVLRRGDTSELVNNINLLLVIFLIYCLTHLSELATQNTVLIEEHCEQNFCLAANLASFLRPSGRRRFPSRWLCLYFWIVATDPCLSPLMFHKTPASDSSHWSNAVSANKRFSICSVVSTCGWTSPQLVSCPDLGSQLHGTNPLLRTFLWSLVFHNLSTTHLFINHFTLPGRSTVVRDVL